MPSKPTLVLGQGALFSRILGLVREMSIGALLGGTSVTDALFIAFRFPKVTQALFFEGAMAYNLVPAYQVSRQKGLAEAFIFARSMMVALFCVSLALLLPVVFFSHQAVLFLAPGFAAIPGMVRTAANFLVPCILALPFLAVCAVLSSASMCEGKFHNPAYGAVVANCTILLCALAGYLLYGLKDERSAYILCAGGFIAGVTQCVYQFFPLYGLGFKLFGALQLRAGLISASLRALPGSVIGLAGMQISIFIAIFFSSFLEAGTITALYLAERIIQFPIGIIGASIGLASLTELTKLLAPAESPNGLEEGKTAFMAHLAKAVRVALFFALPATLGLCFLASPLTNALFRHGAFDAESLARTSNAIMTFCVGLPAMILMRPLLSALAALGDTRTPPLAAVAYVVITTLSCGPAVALSLPWGPSLAVSIGCIVNTMILLHALAKQEVYPLPNVIWMGKCALASLVMAGAVLLAGSVFADTGKLLIAPVGVLVYFLAAGLLRMEDAIMGTNIIVKLFKKK
ncbi:putative lipid II flippase MurJ [Deltaproteobacteria bacterium]|nr:putative lipid II flippase MurJ [Deltaproteobacteria bacterium]